MAGCREDMDRELRNGAGQKHLARPNAIYVDNDENETENRSRLMK